MRYPQRKVADMLLIWPKEEITCAAGSRAGGRGLLVYATKSPRTENGDAGCNVFPSWYQSALV